MKNNFRSTVRPKLIMTVGLPGAGKTTEAKRLETKCNAVRFTPDEWMKPLFGDSTGEGARDVVEGKLIVLAERLLSLDVSVILDFGFWAQDERNAIKHIARKAAADLVFVYEETTMGERAARVIARKDPNSFSISQDDLETYENQFEVPSTREIMTNNPGPPPADFGSWDDWILARWPRTLAR